MKRDSTDRLLRSQDSEAGLGNKWTEVSLCLQQGSGSSTLKAEKVAEEELNTAIVSAQTDIPLQGLVALRD